MAGVGGEGTVDLGSDTGRGEMGDCPQADAPAMVATSRLGTKLRPFIKRMTLSQLTGNPEGEYFPGNHGSPEKRLPDQVH